MTRRKDQRPTGDRFSALESPVCRASAEDARMEFAIRFADWADEQPWPISGQRVVATFGCSRSVAYRWLGAWRSARGHSA